MIVYPRIIAHRCGGVLAPENTLAGLDAAAKIGCRAVEFDVMLTADGVPILMHDETLERTTNCTGRTSDKTWAEIHGCDAAVPTLEEAIATCHRLGLWVNVELKPAAGYEEETGNIVGRWLATHWDGRGVISSFSEKSALAARRHLPQAAFAMLWESLPDDWRAICMRLGTVAVHLDAVHVDAGVAARLRAVGLPWAAYTVNEPGEAERLFGLGCHAIFTDRIDRRILPA